MTPFKQLSIAITAGVLALTTPAYADILSQENISDSYWLPKQREPDDRMSWVKMHLKRFDLLAGKDRILDEADLARQRQVSGERTDLRSRLEFLSVDEDIDGTISIEEMSEFDFSDGARSEDMNVRFARIDGNNDGVVSEREWLEEGVRQQAKRDKGNPDYTAYEFKRYWGVSPKDDKSLSSAEYEAALGQLYDLYDQNGDGKLSKAEAESWQKTVLAVELVKLLKEYPELGNNPESMKLIDEIKKARGI